MVALAKVHLRTSTSRWSRCRADATVWNRNYLTPHDRPDEEWEHSRYANRDLEVYALRTG
jgi:hypothetical protein